MSPSPLSPRKEKRSPGDLSETPVAGAWGGHYGGGGRVHRTHSAQTHKRVEGSSAEKVGIVLHGAILGVEDCELTPCVNEDLGG